MYRRLRHFRSFSRKFSVCKRARRNFYRHSRLDLSFSLLKFDFKQYPARSWTSGHYLLPESVFLRYPHLLCSGRHPHVWHTELSGRDPGQSDLCCTVRTFHFKPETTLAFIFWFSPSLFLTMRNTLLRSFPVFLHFYRYGSSHSIFFRLLILPPFYRSFYFC